MGTDLSSTFSPDECPPLSKRSGFTNRISSVFLKLFGSFHIPSRSNSQPNAPKNCCITESPIKSNAPFSDANLENNSYNGF